VIERVAEEPVAEVGLIAADPPAGRPVTGPRLTAPVQSVRVSEIVELVDAPWTSVWADGLTESPKFATFCPITTRLVDADRDSEPLVAVTVGVYVAAFGCPPPMVSVAEVPLEPAGTGTCTVEPDEVVVPTVQAAEVPFGRLPAFSVTVPANPFDGLRVTVYFAEAPELIVWLDGATVTLKSGPVVASTAAAVASATTRTASAAISLRLARRFELV
jgi:hypothetical protein